MVRYVQTIIQIIRCADNLDLCQHCLHVDKVSAAGNFIFGLDSHTVLSLF